MHKWFNLVSPAALHMHKIGQVMTSGVYFLHVGGQSGNLKPDVAEVELVVDAKFTVPLNTALPFEVSVQVPENLEFHLPPGLTH
jgi:hypothetical protein